MTFCKKLSDAPAALILDLDLGINYELVDFEPGTVVIRVESCNSKG